MADIDAGELFKLAADLNRAAGKVVGRAQKVNFKAAMNIKNTWREAAVSSSGSHARLYPYSINFDTKTSAGNLIETEIGPDKNRPQGPLGNLLEFGSVNNSGSGDGQAAADKEEDRYLDELAKTMSDLW